MSLRVPLAARVAQRCELRVVRTIQGVSGISARQQACAKHLPNDSLPEERRWRGCSATVGTWEETWEEVEQQLFVAWEEVEEQPLWGQEREVEQQQLVTGCIVRWQPPGRCILLDRKREA